MRIDDWIANRQFALSEGSMYERLRRHPGVRFDPELAHATLIYDAKDRELLTQLHREYLDVGQRHGLAMFALTDTWRANAERIARSAFADQAVNHDNARYLRALCDSYRGGPPIFVGGQIGPKGDAYTPAEAPDAATAAAFHAAQLGALAAGGVDFLYAATLPALDEARGIAAAMAATGLPYVLSFVVDGAGALLDGTPLSAAMRDLDRGPVRAPLGYALNCVHPRRFAAALQRLESEGAGLAARVLSFQANTADLEPHELAGLDELQVEDPDALAESMIGSYRRFGVPFYGGCCGTDTRHIEALARAYASGH
jgi:homocysteine S-methyltransferase